MVLSELLYYHATEGGLLDADSARDLAIDAGIKTSGIDFAKEADSVNLNAIGATLRGAVLGARVFHTEDGYRFAEMACGTITDGDIDWPNETAFSAAMCDHGIAYSVTRIC